MRAEPLAVDPHRDEQDGGDCERDEGELPIDSRSDVDHPGDRHGRGEKRNQAGDRDVLDGLSVVLDPVRGVRRSPRIVIREREALRMREQAAPELKEQLLASVGGQHQVAGLLHLLEKRDQHEEPCRHEQDARLRMPHAPRHEHGDKSGQWVRADDGVDGDLER